MSERVLEREIERERERELSIREKTWIELISEVFQHTQRQFIDQLVILYLII